MFNKPHFHEGKVLNLLITGVSGFIGSFLYKNLTINNHVIGLSRNDTVKYTQSPPIDDQEAWLGVLRDIDVVIHCAGRAHILNDRSDSLMFDFRVANVEFASKVARYSIKSGVKRFIFFSSLGVNGAESDIVPFTEEMEPNPVYEYALSKLEAEDMLKAMCCNTEMDLVIVRPPLVYAPDAPGNFNRLLKLTKLGIPLPFSGLKNRRSIISIKNLASFVECCCYHPAAANQTFLISDNDVISTSDIIKYLRFGMGKRANQFYVPAFFIIFVSKLFRMENTYKKLFSNLEVSNEKATRLLGWTPLEGTHEALVETGKKYIDTDV